MVYVQVCASVFVCTGLNNKVGGGRERQCNLNKFIFFSIQKKVNFSSLLEIHARHCVASGAPCQTFCFLPSYLYIVSVHVWSLQMAWLHNQMSCNTGLAGWENRNVCMIYGLERRVLDFLEAASPEDGKHTKSKVTRHCFLADSIEILKGGHHATADIYSLNLFVFRRSSY